MKHHDLVQVIVSWYKKNKRNLPWRETTDPYLIWLSEILLQQTRVDQGLPYYIKFVTTFPTIFSLAKAEEQEILKLWEGLGYYSRARNLHYTAKKIVSEFNGVIPGSYEELIKLKGVGKYTASAIASFAFKENVAVLDGNVFRVLSRIFGVKTNIASGQGQKEFSHLAAQILPAFNSHIYNQGIMEFGALHCTPALPKCQTCPAEHFCYAKEHNLQGSLPVKIKTLVKKTRYLNYLVFTYKGKILMRERVNKDIWKGLYEFHVVEHSGIEETENLLAHLSTVNRALKWIIKSESKIFKHLLTHQTLFAKFWVVEIKNNNDFKYLQQELMLRSFDEKEFKSLPKPVLINNFLQEFNFY